MSIFHLHSGKVQRQSYSVANGRDESQLANKKTQAVAAHVLLMSCSYE